MKKLLLVALMLVVATSAFAVELKLKGKMNVRGQYFSNYDYDTETAVEDFDNGVWDQDMQVQTTFVVDKDTKVVAKFSLEDDDWDTNGYDGSGDDNIRVERAYLSYNLTPSLNLMAGRVTGGGWAYDFGNNVEGLHRVKFTYKVDKNTKVIAFFQKNDEAMLSAAANYEDSDDDDSDSYFLGLVTKMGNLTFQPGVSVTIDGANGGDDDSTTTKVDVALGGDFGSFGFESEVIYLTSDNDMGLDRNELGLFLNVFANVKPATLGFMYAYASGDDDGSDEDDETFNMADDFEFNILGNWIHDGTPGLSLFVPYVEYKVGKWSFGAKFIYTMVNNDNYGDDVDSAGWELDLDAKYKFTKNVAYSLGLGYWDIDEDWAEDVEGDDDVENMTRLYHKIEVKF